MPKFSIILPTHDGHDRIMTALSSVARQTFKDYELIVVCDACTDDTRYVAMRYNAKVINVDFHRDGLARNAGLDEATGDWIIFLDDDDWFLHEYVLAQLDTVIGKNNEDVLNFSFIVKGVEYFSQSQKRYYTGICGHCFRREFIGDKRFSDLEYGSDSELVQKLMESASSVVFWDMPMYYYNYMRDGSLSWKKSRADHE